jgi:hypothetical protein
LRRNHQKYLVFLLDTQYNATMKSGGKMLACMAGAISLCITTRAAIDTTDTDIPYQDIVTRNVFALKPPPPPPNPEDSKPPPSKITLTGIWTVNGKLALMKTAAPPAKPGEQAKGDRYYTLHIGERDGDIEVVDIDEKTGSVTVLNSGQQEILTFEKNGVKLAATPLPTTPGIPGALPGVPPPPTGMIPPPIRADGSPTFPGFPTRTIRSTPPATGGVTPGYGMATPTMPTTVAQQPRVQLSPEETTIIMEAERQRLINKGNPNAMIMPPTEFSRQLPQPGATPGGVPNPMPR